MMVTRRSVLAGAIASGARATAQQNVLLPPGLPDPLRTASGKPVETASEWFRVRRPELIEQFTREMYGRAPGRPEGLTFRSNGPTATALDGLAIRKQITITFSAGWPVPAMDLLLYLPAQGKGPFPVILGMNFWGNHAITADPGVSLSRTWIESGRNPFADLSCVVDHRATAACRGINARQWPLETILGRGYALATFYRGDIDPDRADGFASSIRARYPELADGGDNFSTIGAWAWALSRALDYLETDGNIDAKRVALFGWSRLGKAALWAGAADSRFALVISNESGAGGAKLFRRGVGENIRRLNTVFPHWYCRNFRKYSDRDTELPFDQHLVIAAIAPRPVYIGSAERDTGADPEGEFVALKAAEPVYRLLGQPGLPAERWPRVDQAVIGPCLAYHVRSGGHDVTDFDWTHYLAFIARCF